MQGPNTACSCSAKKFFGSNMLCDVLENVRRCEDEVEGGKEGRRVGG